MGLMTNTNTRLHYRSPLFLCVTCLCVSESEMMASGKGFPSPPRLRRHCSLLLPVTTASYNLLPTPLLLLLLLLLVLLLLLLLLLLQLLLLLLLLLLSPAPCTSGPAGLSHLKKCRPVDPLESVTISIYALHTRLEHTSSDITVTPNC